MKLYRDFLKRTIDVAVSGCAVFVLAVPLATVAVWLHFANKGAGRSSCRNGRVRTTQRRYATYSHETPLYPRRPRNGREGKECGNKE